MIRTLQLAIRCFALIAFSCVATLAAAQNCSVSITNVSNPQCYGGCNGMATAVGTGTAPINYQWSPTMQTTATANSLCAGTHTVTMFDATGCTATATVTITQPPQLLTAASTGGNDTICPNTCTMIVGTAMGGTSPYIFTWSPATGLSNTTGSATTACPTSTTTYTMTVIDANNCTSTSTATIVVQPGALAAACCNSTICAGGSVTLNATGNGGPPVWTPATGLNTTTGYTVVASPAATTTYTATLTNSFGCSDTAAVTVTVDPCVGIDEQKEITSVHVIPNPSAGIFTIQSSEIILEVTVTDLLGKIVRHVSDVHSAALTLSLVESPPGIYLLSIKTAKEIIPGRIIRE